MSDPIAEINAGIYGRLGTAIYSYRTGSGTALYSGTLPVFNTMAVQEAPAPYVVFQPLTDIDIYTMSSKSEQSFDYSLRVLSLRAYPMQEADPIYATAHQNIQDAFWVMTGWKIMRVRRQSRITPYRDSAGYWNVGGLYRVDIAKT